MKSRSTLLLLLLAGGIFAYIKFVDSNRLSTLDAQREAKKVVSLDRDKINSVTIKSAEGTIELRKRDNDVWMLEAPVKDRASSMVIAGLFTTAEFLNFDAVLGADKPVSKDELKDYGLASSETKVTFGGGEKPVELLFGKDAAIEGKLYVKLADDKKVFVISNELKKQITKRADEFRDRKLTDLTTAQIASFVADSANLAAYGLQEPRGTVSLFSEGIDKPTVLQIGAHPKDEADKIYARLSTRESVVVLPKSVEALLDTKPNDLRDKSLLRVESDIVDRITIEGASHEKIVLARSAESWVRKAERDLPVNVAEAARLLTDLQNTQVASFEADVATDLPKYGLDQPTVKVTLSSYASENTPETKAGERPIVTVLFGKVEGDKVYAKLDEEPFIVSLSKSILDTIHTDPIQWQELAIYKMKPEEITAIEVTREGQPPVALEREKDKWKLAKGDGSLNQINAQSLVNTLATLRAVRWNGAAKPEDGLDKPTVIVTFETSANVSGKLTVGAKSADEMWNSTAGGLTGVFAMSKPDEEALVLPLVDKPAAPPPPAQPAPAAPDAAATPPLPN